MRLASTFYRTWQMALGGAIVLSTLLAVAQVPAADIVFQEDFTLRPFLFSPPGANYVDGTSPNIVNSDDAVYTWRQQYNGGPPPWGDAQMSPFPATDVGWPDPTGLTGNALKLQTSTAVNSFLSLDHEFNLQNPIRIEITALIDINSYAKWWDGFSFGLNSDNSGFFGDYITVAQDTITSQNIEFRAGGLVNSVPVSGSTPFDYDDIGNLLYIPHTFVATYDPTLAVGGVR